MASKAMETDRKEDYFWREFPAMADYFSPGIVPLLNYLGLSSKTVMHEFGEQVGKKAAAKMANLSLDQMLEEFSRIWEEYRIGRLSVEGRDPLVLQISNCTVCGQLQGTGEMYECAFHEGFFQGALSARLGKPVDLHQQTNYEGEAGTWCRRLVADIRV
jgi:predicted hydrocarbon binding protein